MGIIPTNTMINSSLRRSVGLSAIALAILCFTQASACRYGPCIDGYCRYGPCLDWPPSLRRRLPAFDMSKYKILKMIEKDPQNINYKQAVTDIYKAARRDVQFSELN